MSLSAREIEQVAVTLDKDIFGGLLRKVLSPKISDHLVLELWTSSGKELLQFVLTPQLTRLGRIKKKPEIAKVPHPFVMLLRRFAVGMAITGVHRLNDDRVVSIGFKGRDRSGTLICELTSQHSNIFWLDAAGIIVGSFHLSRSHKRTLIPGVPYQIPIQRSLLVDKVDRSRFETASSIEEAIDEHYSSLEAQNNLNDLRAAVARSMRLARRKLTRLSKNLTDDKKRADEADALQKNAYLLQANLHLATKGISQMEVVDFEGQPAIITLDPSLDPIKNMTKMFDRSKRLRRATSKIDERLNDALKWKQRIELLSAEVPSANEQKLSEIVSTLFARFPDLAQKASPGKRRQETRLPYKEFAIASNKTARVGRSAEDNDTLTLRHAKPNDLWMHVRGRKGSHVVVSLERGENPPAEVLIDAAHLAVYFSDARGDEDVEVSHTLRKYVQKPRGAPKGSVRLLREKTLLLRVNKNRLEIIFKKQLPVA